MTGDAHDEEASLAAQIRGEQAETELQRRHPFGLAMIEPEEQFAGEHVVMSFGPCGLLALPDQPAVQPCATIIVVSRHNLLQFQDLGRHDQISAGRQISKHMSQTACCITLTDWTPRH